MHYNLSGSFMIGIALILEASDNSNQRLDWHIVEKIVWDCDSACLFITAILLIAIHRSRDHLCLIVKLPAKHLRSNKLANHFKKTNPIWNFH